MNIRSRVAPKPRLGRKSGASNLWVIRRRGRQKFRRSYGASSLLKRSPIPASPVRWPRPATTSHQSSPAGEGAPVFREPALTASGAMSRERRRHRVSGGPWRAGANVRRRDAGDAEAPFEPIQGKPSGPRTCGWFIGGAGKSFVVLSVPRHSSSVRRSPPRLLVGTEQIHSRTRKRPQRHILHVTHGADGAGSIGDSVAASVGGAMGPPL